MSSHEPKIASSTHLNHSGIPDHDELKRLASELLASESIVDDDHAPIDHAPIDHAPIVHAPIVHAPIVHAPIVSTAPSAKIRAPKNVSDDAESDLGLDREC